MRRLLGLAVLLPLTAVASPVYLKCTAETGDLRDVDVTVDEAINSVTQSIYPRKFEDVQFLPGEVRYRLTDRIASIRTTYEFTLDRKTLGLTRRLTVVGDYGQPSESSASSQCVVVDATDRKF